MCLQFYKLCLFFSFLVFTNGTKSEQCGVVAKPKDNRIVGGNVIGYMKYPWFAALMLTSNPKQLTCGGALIGRRHVLTAAHCYKPFFAGYKYGKIMLEDQYVVQLGINNICIPDNNTKIYATLKVYIHEKYFVDLLYNDIALILLDYEANDFMAVCLPPARYDSVNRTNLLATIVGLGKESSNAWRLPCQVKEATVNIQTDTTCKTFLKRRQSSSRLHNAFCAGSGQGDIDTCQGDSGGPLQVYMDDNRFMMLGITSYGYGCAEKYTYGVYTDVSHYLDWINNKIELGEKHDVNAKETDSERITSSTTSTTAAPIKKAATKIKRQQRRPPKILQQILNW